MKILVPRKYFNSKLRGILIKYLKVYDNGRIIVVNEINDSKEFQLELNNITEYSADYLMCEIQDDSEISIQK